jgi:predicted nucleic acid-binding protein
LARRDRRREALQLARNALLLFPEMLQVGARELGTACEVPESAPGLPPRDAVRAETMLNHSPSAIITADEHSAHLPQLRRIPAHGG